MPVDNQMYERSADAWWDRDSSFGSLRSLNPVRFGYLQEVLRKEVGPDARGRTLLDTGCGGGLLAEEFARAGYSVTGIDISSRSIETASTHAREGGLQIEYQVASADRLPFDEGSFDVVCCADMLEHVDDLAAVVAETARVLRRRGVYLYLTVNRTLRSKLTVIKVLQEWKWTRYLEPDTHDWSMFIKPGELCELLARSGMHNRDLVGLAPGANPLRILRSLRKLSRGEITHAEMGEAMDMKLSRDVSGLYAGYAVKL
jgi:2-polyprenyl-6-hydroxyphenyl methylase/3-demethylubiquinone-9 3-methyltransferase